MTGPCGARFLYKTALSRYYRRMDIQAIEGRSDLMQAMRDWFRTHAYLEVSTPTLATDLIPEPTIQNFSTTLVSEFLGDREFYLIPSPEIHMKNIIAETKRSIYQFSRCFRNSEQVGNLHNPEFTMLEYYTMGADDEDSIGITEELLAATALPGTPQEVKPPFRRMTVAEACRTYAGFDLARNQNPADLRSVAKGLGLQTPPGGESWEDTFNRIFLNVVEPNLPQERPLVLQDYPMQIECLARRKGKSPYRRRWELYMQGVEVANCYDEETDTAIIADYYRRQSAVLAAQRAGSPAVIPDTDPSFATMFGPSYPSCSGVALGFDRLLMLQLGRKSLRGVILFSLSDILG